MNKSKRFFTGLLLAAYFLSSCKFSEDIRFECPEVETDLSGLKSNGSLVLDGDETYRMDMDSLVKTQLNKAGNNFYYFAASPEHNWIAYNSGEINELVVEGVNHKDTKFIPGKEDWAYAEWLNEKQLIVDLIQEEDNFDTVSKFLVLNPFTNERYFLDANYPEIFYDYWWRIIEYNGNLDQVVYLQGDISGPFYYTLWDIPNKKTIVQLNANGDLHVFPRWSSDGSQFVMALSLSLEKGDFPSYEIFQVSREGRITQLTHLSDYYPWVYVRDLSWSPNNRYIAFWYSHWSEDEEPFFGTPGDRYLGVLDLNTGDVTSYCINGELDVELGSNKYSSPLWSPDSKQIIFRSQIGEHYVLDSQTILLDIQENRAFLIGTALEPVGWLRSP